MDRSYLFAPGHNAKLLDRVFRAGADAVMLDLEDAVPPEAKDTARAMVAEALLDQPAWVRINAARTDWCAADLDALAGRALGIRIPKVESAAEVYWVTDRVPGTPIICAIETARGVLAAQEIAATPGVRFLAMGGVDLQRDLNTTGGNLQTLYTRSHLVLASRAAGIEPPIDSVYPLLDDTDGLRIRRCSPDRSGSSASRPSTHASCRSCTRCSPPARRRSNGHCRFSTASSGSAVAASPCPAGSSSTSPSRTGRGDCWTSPGSGPRSRVPADIHAEFQSAQY